MVLPIDPEEITKDFSKIKVLDHGFVRLVDYMGNDLSIVRAARVSYDAAWRAGTDAGSDARLIRRLYKDNHSTPFEAVEFQFEIKAPVFVVRQWHRHRTWSYNELSARYRELPEEFYIPDPANVGIQSKDNKQGRTVGNHDYADERQDQVDVLEEQCRKSFKIYKYLLDNDWPRELARMVLPFNIYTHMFGKVNLRNLFGFLDLRCDAHAQYEIRQYANAIVELIKPIVPVAVEAWEEGKNG